MLLENKIILITGGSRGIGKAVAEKCLKEGAKVVIDYKNSCEKIETLVKEYGEDKIITYKTDVSNADDVKQMITYVKEVFGHLDGIVNNAGIITRTYDWKNISLQDWNTNIGTNLIGSWNVIRFGVDIMEKGGSIVNVSSIYGMFPEADELTYSISKAGVEALTQAIAKKLAPNIRVNAIAPGNTLTEMVPDSERLNEIEEKTVLKRSAKPEEIANSIVYLLSEQSSYITGCIIPVDGGYHII